MAQDKELCSACNATAPAPRRSWARSSARAITTTSPLLNSKGGIEGYKIRVLEIDNEYKVPPAMEAHERFKKEGAVLTASTARRKPLH